MIIGITTAVEFLIRLLQGQHRGKQLNDTQLASFKDSLIKLLKKNTKATGTKSTRIEDQQDVSYRIGENGSMSLLYGTEYKEEQAVSVSTEVAPPTQSPAVMWQFNPQTVFCYAYAAPVLIEMDQLQSPSICYSDPRQMEPFNPQTALLPDELTLWNHQEHSEKYSEEDVLYYSFTAP
ncbi:hypothetical protein J6590_094589 [Homalodisca vitripennis]|nr:hypothetical protein J6590_094589 [Homalodisca vitripennis]